MSIRKEQVASELAGRGYRVIHETDKKQCWRLGHGMPIYVNLKSASGTSSMIVHPDVRAPQLANEAEGSICAPTWFHSSNLKLYPKRQHRGMNPISYGWPMTFDSEEGMKAFLSRLEANA
jgi:hypothetical protein